MAHSSSSQSCGKAEEASKVSPGTRETVGRGGPCLGRRGQGKTPGNRGSRVTSLKAHVVYRYGRPPGEQESLPFDGGSTRETGQLRGYPACRANRSSAEGPGHLPPGLLQQIHLCPGQEAARDLGHISASGHEAGVG